MPKIRVSAFAVSLDGYAAGPRQSLDNPLAFAAQSCSNGSSPRARGSRCTARKAARLVSITNGHSEAWTTSGPGFSAGTCLDLCAVRGGTTRGKDGGVTNRLIIVPTFVLTHHPRPPVEMNGRDTFCTAACERHCKRPGRTNRRGSCNDSAVSPCKAYRRTSPRISSDSYGLGREPTRRH